MASGKSIFLTYSALALRSGRTAIDHPRWREPAADMAQDANGEMARRPELSTADAHDYIMSGSETDLPHTDPMQWGGKLW